MANKVGGNTGNRGKGRPKGSQNKFTGDIKAMVHAALDALGGEQYLIRQAKEHPAPFLALVGKIIPRDVNATLNGNLTVQWPLPKTALDQ